MRQAKNNSIMHKIQLQQLFTGKETTVLKSLPAVTTSQRVKKKICVQREKKLLTEQESNYSFLLE